MRALVVVATLTAGGGIESALMNFLRSASVDGLSIDICLMDQKEGSLAPAVRALGHKIWKCAFYKNPLTYVRNYEAALRQHGPYDVIHSHVGDFSGPILSAARRVGIPVRIAHYHNISAGHSNDWKRRLYHTVIRRNVLRDATAIVGCSWGALQSWFPREWAIDTRMCVVRNGVELERFSDLSAGVAVRRDLGIPLDAPVIGHVGRFVWQKNHIGMIEAAQQVVARIPDARFLLVGGGPLQAQIEQRVAQLGLRRNVIFAGFQANVPRYLAAMDVFTLPSTAEGFGLVAVEAQAAGLPAAVSRLPGPLEAVSCEMHDYAFDCNDATDMADALVRLIEDSRADGHLAAAARAFAERFGADATADQLLSVWGLDVVTRAETFASREVAPAAVPTAAHARLVARAAA